MSPIVARSLSVRLAILVLPLVALAPSVRADVPPRPSEAVPPPVPAAEHEEHAGEPDEEPSEEDVKAALAEMESKFAWQRGTIVVGDKLATLEIPDAYRYLGPQDSKKILEDIWGNPPGPLTLGMLFPSDKSPLTNAGWGVVITYDEDGHVDDSDAKKLDYAELLSDMKKDTAEENAEREKLGFGAIDLVGWAEPPRYDEAAKKLYWAKELEFNKSPEHTLNYSVRILGRKGVLVMNAVAGMEQLAEVRAAMQTVIGFTDFNQGSRYADFTPGVDKVAAYGIGALVAGKLVAKAGLLKVLLGVLLAGKKAFFALFAVLVAGASRFFGKKKDEDAPTGSATAPPVVDSEGAASGVEDKAAAGPAPGEGDPPTSAG